MAHWKGCLPEKPFRLYADALPQALLTKRKEGRRNGFHKK